MERKQLRKKYVSGMAGGDCCATCARYSSEGYRVTGICMKMRKCVKAKFICGYYTPEVKASFVQEYKSWMNNSLFKNNLYFWLYYLVVS